MSQSDTGGRVQLEAFEWVLLRRPTSRTNYDDETLERIQRGHTAFLERVREEGHALTSGPVLDQPDESLRGLSIYNVGSIERARELAQSDPAVVAGRIALEVMTWWCPAGSMIQDRKSTRLNSS